MICGERNDWKQSGETPSDEKQSGGNQSDGRQNGVTKNGVMGYDVTV